MTTTVLPAVVSLSFLLAHGTGVVGQVVNAPSGSYQGSTFTVEKNLQYVAYRGIPYAQPPTGNLRFEKPSPMPPLSGVYNATEFKPYCVQFNAGASPYPQGQEDCLYLNVYTPTFDPATVTQPKKVFVFIHGGSNQFGFSDLYVPGSLVSWHDVIVVTFNYRMAMLGFLSTGTDVCPGNFGLWDQLEALAWVKANIRAFGGDPDDVTVGGESAGSIDTSVLALTAQGQELFRRVFLMSGTVGVASAANMDPDPTALTLTFARREGCLAEDDPDPKTDADWSPVITCLRQVPVARFADESDLGGTVLIGPVVDGQLLPKPIKELFSDPVYLTSTGVKDKDFLVTVVNNEGAIYDMVADTTIASMPPQQAQALPPDFFLRQFLQAFLLPLTSGQPINPALMDKLVRYYQNEAVISPISDLAGDQVFYLPSLEYINALKKSKPQGSGKVFLLYFDHYPKFSAVSNYRGMVHIADLCYLFDLDPTTVNTIIDYKLNGSYWQHVDEVLKLKYSHTAAEFIKHGDPNEGLRGDLLCGWPPYDLAKAHYLQFSDFSEVSRHFRGDRVRLWRKLIPRWIKRCP